MSNRNKLAQKLGGNVAASIQGGNAPALPAAGDRRFQGRLRDEQGACIELDRLYCGEDQPRREFDAAELRHLADSLKDFGQLQPCVVTWEEKAGKYRILAGERRFRAAKMVGFGHLRCIVWHDVGPEDRFELQLIENALRVDLTPMEQARAYQRLKKSRGWNDRRLAERLHVHPAKVTRALALLRLPEAVQGQVESGKLTPSAAYEVSKAPRAQQSGLAEEAAAKKLPRSQVAAKVQEAKRPAAPPGKLAKDAEIVSNVCPWTWTGSKGETIRISPRPGASIFGIVSIANLLTAALAEVQADIDVEVKGVRKQKAG